MGWIKLYERVVMPGRFVSDVGFRARRFGNGKTQYFSGGPAGLVSHSRRPRRCAGRKVFLHEEQLICSLRRD